MRFVERAVNFADKNFEIKNPKHKNLWTKTLHNFFDAETMLRFSEKALKLSTDTKGSLLEGEFISLANYFSNVSRRRETEEHWDDMTYQQVKGLGILLAKHGKMHDKFKLESEKISLKEDDEVMFLHLPQVPEEERGKLFSMATESIQKLVDYIKTNELNPKYIIAISYDEIVRLSKRYGFEVDAEVKVSEQMEDLIKQAYIKSGRSEDGQEPKVSMAFATVADLEKKLLDKQETKKE